MEKKLLKKHLKQHKKLLSDIKKGQMSSSSNSIEIHKESTEGILGETALFSVEMHDVKDNPEIKEV